MTDRELLEMAAKASGCEVERYSEKYGVLISVADGVIMWWNPLLNDGEALRLAVKLNLRVMPQEECVYVESNPDSVLGFASVSEMNGDRPYTATRRAIVRAAAEIGKAN